MVDTITPAVGGARRGRYRLAVALHALGATSAAGGFGAMLGLIGMLLGAPWRGWGLGLLAAVAGIYAVGETASLTIPIPARRRQVPSWWRTFFSLPVAAFLYGLGLGIGFLTYLSFGTLVAVSFAALVAGSPALGAALVAPFGLARALAVGAANGGRAGDSGDPRDPIDRLEHLAATPLPRAANVVALATVALASIAVVA